MKGITTTQNIQNFVFGESEVRVIMQDNEPLFCLSDVCGVLGFRDGTHLKRAIDKEFDKRGDFKLYPLEGRGGIQNYSFINESELYFVLIRSKSKRAKPFRQWVVNDVLPSIRKTGSYAIKAPTTLLEALELAVEQQKQILKLEAQNQSQAHCIEYQKGVLQNYKEVEKSYRHKAELAKRLNDTIRLYAQQKLNKDYGLAYNTIYGLFAKRHHIKDKINMAYLKKNIDYLAECLSIVSAELDLVDVKEIL